jgi:hypothetical protein
MAHLQEPPPKLSDKQLQPVLDKAMAKKPADRFQTAGELAGAARAAARGEKVVRERPRPSRRGLLVGAAVLAVLAAVAVTIVLLTSGDSGPSASAYERQVAASDATLEREVAAVAKRDAQGGSLDARIERNIQVRDAIRRGTQRLEAVKPPHAVARDHAVLVDGYRLLVEELDDAIGAARHGDAAALERVDRRFANGQSASARQVNRATRRIEAALQ